jgi:hypothetical protein
MYMPEIEKYTKVVQERTGLMPITIPYVLIPLKERYVTFLVKPDLAGEITSLLMHNEVSLSGCDDDFIKDELGGSIGDHPVSSLYNAYGGWVAEQTKAEGPDQHLVLGSHQQDQRAA